MVRIWWEPGGTDIIGVSNIHKEEGLYPPISPLSHNVHSIPSCSIACYWIYTVCYMSTEKEFEKKVHIYSCMYSFLFFYLGMIFEWRLVEGSHPGVSHIYTFDTLHMNWWHTAHKCVVHLPNVSLSRFGECDAVGTPCHPAHLDATKPDTNGGHIWLRGNIHWDIINLIETAASVCQDASDLVYKHGFSYWTPKHAVNFDLLVLVFADYFSLGPTNSDIVANHNEFNAARLVGMERSVLFPCQPKENIIGIIPDSANLINNPEVLRKLEERPPHTWQWLQC